MQRQKRSLDHYWKKSPLWLQIMIALVLGVLGGIILGKKVTVVKPVGELFINAMKMLIIPLVFSSLIAGVTSLSNFQLLRRIAVKTMAIYLVTTAFSSSIGLLVSTLIQPGVGVRLPLPPEDGATFSQAPTLAETLVNLVPANPIEAMAEGNMLQVASFVLPLGVRLQSFSWIVSLPGRFF